MPKSADADVLAVAVAIAAETGLNAADIDARTRLRDLGIESVLSVSIVDRLEPSYGPLGKALLLEFATVGELAAHLGARSTAGENGAGARGEGAGGQVPAPPVIAPDQPAVMTAPISAPVEDQARQPAAGEVIPPIFASASPLVSSPAPHRGTGARRDDGDSADGDIAIIGMAGQFPQAEDIAAYWDGLVGGRDSIEVIPDRLWDWRDFWDERAGVAGASYSKWGGFIPDHRLFDPAFFRISRLEAQSIDPQERVFLETVYHALEHAQYPRTKRDELRIGLFVAVMWGSYQHYGSMTADAGSSYATIANRASFSLGLTGPSIPIDTMCSGSLTTLHLGAQSIRNGECELAVAGGVNLTTHPNKYLVLSRTGFAAHDGRCKPFAAGADGYVPSEGSGALVLKRLDAARRDGDRVLAVLRHSAVNHGGRVNNLTMPNVEAQAALIGGTFAATAIPADSVDYVEAHAPGTELGDPIEVRALAQAFASRGARRTDIPIGSVKSNVGHLESAAGVASVVKVVEQMRHRRLVPSIHAEVVNPNIDFEDSPFALQAGLAPWVPRVDESGAEQPYRAMINCFGAGGTNAHVLLEAGPMRAALPVPGPHEGELFLFSARTPRALESLLQRYRELLETFAGRGESEQARFIAGATVTAVADAAGMAARHIRHDDPLPELLHTEERIVAAPGILLRATGVRLSRAELGGAKTVGQLIELIQFIAIPGCLPRSRDVERAWFQSLARATQTGRDPMEQRAAIVATTAKELAATIDILLADLDADVDGCYRGRVTPAGAAALRQELNDGYVEQLLRNRRLDRLGEFWAHGLEVDWATSFPRAPMHVDLPLYPFDQEICWAPQERPGSARADDRPAVVAPRVDIARSLETGQIHLPLSIEAPEGRSPQASLLARMLAAAVPSGDTSFVARLEPRLDLRTLGAEDTLPDALAVEGAEMGGRIVRCLSGDRILAQIHLGLPAARVPSVSAAGAPTARFALTREDDLAGVLEAVLDSVSTTTEPLLAGHIIRHAALPKSGSVLLSPRSAGEIEALVVDDAGAPVLTCTRIAQVTASAAPEPGTAPVRRFTSSWEPVEPPPGDTVPPAGLLVVAPNAAVADRLAEAPRFAAASVQHILLRRGGDSQLLPDGRWEIRLGDLTALRACLRLVDDPGAIVFVSAGEPSTAADEMTALHLLAQEAIRRNLFRRGSTDVVIVTRGLAPIPGEAATPSGLGGYVRTLTREVRYPIAHIDLESGTALAAEQAAVISRAPGWPDHTRPFALRGRTLWRESIEETPQHGAPAPQFRQDGHYVLFGGTGTVGRQVSVELARRHRVRLTWVSRGPLSAEAEAATQAIRNLGSEVRHVRADVTDTDAVRRACADSREHFGPIDGMMHMTMTRNIRRIADLDAAEFADLIADKVSGTDSLLRAAGDEAPEFTLLFSSIDAHVGSVGWSAYSAGCSYQLAVAAKAQADGRPVYAIGWGFWAGIDAAVAASLAEKGIGVISPAQGVEAMQAVLSMSGTRPILTVAEDTALEAMGFTLSPARRATSASSPAPGPAESGIETRRTPVIETEARPRPVAHEFPTGEAVGDVLSGLRSLFAEILKTGNDTMDPDSDLLNYGVDSLIVVNIQATMEERLGPVPTALLLENSTLRQIADVIERDHPQVARALRTSTTAAGHEQRSGLAAPEPAGAVSTGRSVRILRQVAADGIDAFLRAYPSLHDQKMLDRGPAPMLSRDQETGALTHGMVRLDGGEIEFLSVGEGDPVIIFSAVALTVPVWTHILTSDLVARHRLMVIHQPGYGLSQAISGCGSRETARVMLDAARSLGEEGPYHLLASCLGCVPAMHFAADFPDRTSSMTLVGAFHDSSDLEAGDPSTMSSAEFQKLAETAVATLHRDFDAVAKAEASAGGGSEVAARIEDSRQLLISSQKVNFLVALRYLNEMMTTSMAPVLKRITARSACIYGDADQIISPRHSLEIASLLGAAETTCVANSGHFPYLTHPADFLSCYAAFLTGTEGGS